LHRAVRTTLEACAERSSRSAVYGRRVEIAFLDLAEDPAARVGQVDRFLHDRGAFALVWSFFSGAEVELADLLAARGVPALGAFTPFPPITVPPNRYVFHLDGGARSEAFGLVAHAGERTRRLAILVGEGRAPGDLAAAVEARARAAGFLEVERMPLPPAGPSLASKALAGQLAGRSIDALCVLGPPEHWVPLLDAAATSGWKPLVLVPGSLATPRLFEAPPECDDRLVVAFSMRPEADDARWTRLAAGYGLSDDHPQARWLALASVTLLVEALKRAGPDVTREALVTTLERFQDVLIVAIPTPLSFGPNRRIGVPGAHLTRIRRESRSFVATSRPIATGE
jgi:branched-chain amino acid transport system substrate-binding protein